jgi:hypothetical protein
LRAPEQEVQLVAIIEQLAQVLAQSWQMLSFPNFVGGHEDVQVFSFKKFSPSQAVQ